MEAWRDGAIVQQRLGGPEMLVVGQVDDFQWAGGRHPGVLCVWEVDHLLHEKTFAQSELVLLPDPQSHYDRKGQRRIPGAGVR
jgi:uncharacterized protein YodC (DUF2158 family)